MVGEYRHCRAEFEKIKSKFSELVGEKRTFEDRLERQKEKLKTLEEQIVDSEEARVVIQEIAKRTLANLEFHISKLVTSALQTIPFPEPLSFTAKFESLKDRIECHLFFVKKDRLIPPMLSSGGGPKDVASFALRLTYWTLRKNRPTFWLDEPFRNADLGIQPHVGEMVKRLCEKLHIQIIMNSHQPEIDVKADKIFWLENHGGVAKVVKEETR